MSYEEELFKNRHELQPEQAAELADFYEDIASDPVFGKPGDKTRAAVYRRQAEGQG